MGKRVHRNSVLAYYEEQVRLFGPRKALIYGTLAMAQKPMTARQLNSKLFGAYADLNMTRPRLTDLKTEGWVKEAGNVVDDISGKTVYLMKAISPEQRLRREGSPNELQLESQIATNRIELLLCRTCGRRRPLIAYPRDCTKKNGRHSQCRDCKNRRQKMRRLRKRRKK